MESEKHLARPRVALLGRAKSRHAPLVRYLFGPEPTSVVQPEALLVEIDRLGGVVAPGDIMRVTGLRRAAAEALLCKLAACHGGDVCVAGTAVLYRFPRLVRSLPRLISLGGVPRPIWEQRRLPDAITGNRRSVDQLLLLANLVLLFVGGTMLVRALSSNVGQAFVALLALALAVFALSLPVARLARRRSHVTEVDAENGRRALIRAVLARPVGSNLGAHALSHVWVAASGRAIKQRRLVDEVLALGGEPDVDSQARVYFRFPDLDHEARALTQLRS